MLLPLATCCFCPHGLCPSVAQGQKAGQAMAAQTDFPASGSDCSCCSAQGSTGLPRAGAGSGSRILLLTTLCDEHQNDRQTTMASMEMGNFPSPPAIPAEPRADHRDHPANAPPASEVGKSSWEAVHKAVINQWKWPHINATLSLVCSHTTCF